MPFLSPNQQCQSTEDSLIKVNYNWHCPHSMQSRICVMVHCLSVCLSICLSQHWQRSSFDAVRWQLGCSGMGPHHCAEHQIQACHVCSLWTLLNTDLFIIFHRWFIDIFKIEYLLYLHPSLSYCDRFTDWLLLSVLQTWIKLSDRLVPWWPTHHYSCLHYFCSQNRG